MPLMLCGGVAGKLVVGGAVSQCVVVGTSKLPWSGSLECRESRKPSLETRSV